MTTKKLKTMARLLKKAREDRGLSMRETAREADIPVSTLSKLEKGTLDNPTFLTIVKLGLALDIDPAEWFDIDWRK